MSGEFQSMNKLVKIKSDSKITKQLKSIYGNNFTKDFSIRKNRL